MSIEQPPVVLLVDDEPLIRMAARDMLIDCGAEVIEAQDAHEALALLSERNDIVLIFSDVDMPGDMDGLALITRVHELRPAVELILTSGRARFADGGLPDDGSFLPKPYNASQLCRMVGEKLEGVPLSGKTALLT